MLERPWKAIILDNIPFQIDLAALSSLLHIRPSQGELLQELEQLVHTAQAIGKPKANVQGRLY